MQDIDPQAPDYNADPIGLDAKLIWRMRAMLPDALIVKDEKIWITDYKCIGNGKLEYIS